MREGNPRRQRRRGPPAQEIAAASSDSAPTSAFLEGASTQLRCIEALVVRELMMRYGRGNIGFLWVLLEPMILTIGVMIIWSFIKGDSEHGVNIVALVVTGYMPLTLWRHMSNAGINALKRNASVFYHRRISAIDCILAILVLEFAGSTAALVVVVTTTWTLGLIDPIQDPSSVALGWLMMAGLSAGVSLLICALTEYSEISERFIQPFQYLMLPVSGSFFMVDWLPSDVQQIAWYSPTIHCYEKIRAGFLGESVITYSDPWYVLLWVLALFAVGLPLLQQARDAADFR